MGLSQPSRNFRFFSQAAAFLPGDTVWSAVPVTPFRNSSGMVWEVETSAAHLRDCYSDGQIHMRRRLVATITIRPFGERLLEVRRRGLAT